jgi:hypothetical protein
MAKRKDSGEIILARSNVATRQLLLQQAQQAVEVAHRDLAEAQNSLRAVEAREELARLPEDIIEALRAEAPPSGLTARLVARKLAHRTVGQRYYGHYYTWSYLGQRLHQILTAPVVVDAAPTEAPPAEQPPAEKP